MLTKKYIYANSSLLNLVQSSEKKTVVVLRMQYFFGVLIFIK